MRLIRKLAPLALVCLALPSFAGNLVGTYEGSWSCRTEDANGRGRDRQNPSTLQISQPGGPGTSPLRVVIDAVPYTGSIIPDASDPTERGVGAFVACGTSDTEAVGAFNEIELIRWSVDPGNGRGSIRKVGVFVTNGDGIGACSGSWQRVSVADPGIPACN
jgi:hypothetical protein